MRMCLCTHADGLLVVIIWRILRVRRSLSLLLLFFFLDEHRFLHIEIGKWDEMRNDVVSIAKERK